MENPKAIDRYINQTLMNDAGSVDERHYELLIGDLLERCRVEFSLNTNIKIVYSPSRRVERIKIDSQNWLVYDQYFGQSMNLLNAIFLESDSEEDAIIYFHKYIAEKAMEYGVPYLGVFLANFYSDEKHKVNRNLKTNVNRLLLTINCERFAILHEIGHELLDSSHEKKDGYMRIVHNVMETAYDFHNNFSTDDISRRFCEADPAAYHHADLEKVISDTEEHFQSESGKKIRESYLVALKSKDTENELFCDIFACNLVIMASLENKSDLRAALISAYIASYHLKLFDHVDHLMNQILVDKHFGIEYENIDRRQSIEARNHCIRDYLIEAYREISSEIDRKASDADIKEFAIELMNVQKRYYEMLLDPVWKLMCFISQPGKLEELASDALACLDERAWDVKIEQKDAYSRIICSIAILMQTGWSEASVMRFKDAANLLN